MNCSTARKLLLDCERLDSPEPALNAHLLACPRCRTTQTRLTRIERAISSLEVPACPAPAALFDQVLHGQPLVRTPHRMRHLPDTTKEHARQKLALALALAASLAVFALGWWAWPRPRIETASSPVRKEYVAQLVERLPPGLAQPRAVERLTDFAEELAAEVREHPGDVARLDRLATQFDWLMRQDLPHQAGQLPPDERQAALRSTVARLSQLESQMSRLALENNRGNSARPLRQIAAAVREADRRLRLLAEART